MQSEVVIPKTITKKKMKTRSIPMNPRLWEELASWRVTWMEAQSRDPDKGDYVFPNAKDVTRHMTRQSVDKALRAACSELDVVGASTHSLRRSALTAASDKGVPLSVLQLLSGHSSLEKLGRRGEGKRGRVQDFYDISYIPSCTFIHLHIPLYTLIYIHILSYTSKYPQILPNTTKYICLPSYTPIYFKTYNIRKMKADIRHKNCHNSGPRASPMVRI